MTRTNKRLIVVSVCVALVGWIYISVHYANKREELKKQHTQQTASLKNQWNRERQTRKGEYRAELEKAWGGGIKAVVKDPKLAITDMLRKAGVTACPEAMRVEVKADNFNEFDVFIHVKAPMDKDTAAATVKTLLGDCGKYVNSVSFVYSNEVVKTIDRRGIDAIKDWTSADLASVAGQMYTP